MKLLMHVMSGITYQHLKMRTLHYHEKSGSVGTEIILKQFFSLMARHP